MEASGRLPLVIETTEPGLDAACYLTEHRAELDVLVLDHGAVLLRGFAVSSAAHFDAAVEAVSTQRLSYLYRSTPRTAIGRNIFTATEYPPSEEIPLHNENAYQREWPAHLMFCCLQAADLGGETPLADMRLVTRSIGSALLEKFAELRVKYLRTYRPMIDLPWQTVFQTDDPKQVGWYCEGHGIGYRWLDDQVLQTTQVCQGAAVHPVSGERVFFNQAHLFHLSSVGAKNANTLTMLFGVEGVPRHAQFGDGSAILAAELDCIRGAFAAHAISFPWRPGDILYLDNMQVAHGRRPFRGRRTQLAALLGTAPSHQ
jgi:alpha-ketoglutarate-dependent taurine dioxygenase